MEIKLIKRKLKSGRTSLVLEYYLGYTVGENGKPKANRKYETLEYFLYTTPKDKKERDHNKINLEMAEKVKAKRLLTFHIFSIFIYQAKAFVKHAHAQRHIHTCKSTAKNGLWAPSSSALTVSGAIQQLWSISRTLFIHLCFLDSFS